MPERELPDEMCRLLTRLDELVDLFEQHPEPLVQERAVELLQCIDRIHRSGLQRMVHLLREAGLEEQAQTHPEIQLLIELYELREGGERTRADAVLDLVRPYIQLHGGELEALEVHQGVVKVRLAGACTGCANSAATLRDVVEQVLRESMPGFVALEVAESPPPRPGGFVPLSALQPPQ